MTHVKQLKLKEKKMKISFDFIFSSFILTNFLPFFCLSYVYACLLVIFILFIFCLLPFVSHLHLLSLKDFFPYNEEDFFSLSSLRNSDYYLEITSYEVFGLDVNAGFETLRGSLLLFQINCT